MGERKGRKCFKSNLLNILVLHAAGPSFPRGEGEERKERREGEKVF